MAETAIIEPQKPTRISISFQLGDKLIDGATIRPLTFAAYADCIAQAHRMTQPAAFSARLLRVRMSRQVAYHINGSIVPVTPEEVLRLPVPDFYKIVAGFDGDEGKPGKIVRDGDGIHQAITYELGTPIPSGNKEKSNIVELEFHAATYGDIEDILSADGPAAQTAILIKQVAKPLGDGVTLSRLTDAHFSHLTVADGTEISNVILPRFLGLGSGS